MRRLRRRPHDAVPEEVPRGWFHLAQASEEDLSDSQRRLLQRARQALEALSPGKASAQDSWASLEPHAGTPGTLWLCIPIEGKRHDSLQMGLGGGVIVGGWQDRHYAWDDDRQEAFRAQVMDGAEDGPITKVLNWLEEELRRLG